MNYPKTAIIILNWNGVGHTIECLESLEKITYPSYDVVLVDNGSEGDDVSILRERFGAYAHVIENDRNYGFAEGSNIGIRYALERLRPDFVLLLNNDTVVAPDFLSEMIRVGVTEEKAGIAGPKIYSYNEPGKLWFAGGSINYWTGRTWHRGAGQVDCGQFEDVVDVDFVTGCCMLISRSVLDGIGFLDERFFFGAEDFDVCIRAARAGFRVVFVPCSRIWHKVGRSAKSASRRPGPFVAYYDVRNRFILMEKHWSLPQFATATLAYLTVLPLLLILFLLYDRRWLTLKRFMAGFRDYLLRRW